MIRPHFVLIAAAVLLAASGCSIKKDVPNGLQSESSMIKEPAQMSSTSQTADHNSDADWWRPAAGLTWQWNLTGKLDMDLLTDVIDVDLEVGKSVVDYYHSIGTKVICYINVGSYENWRADAERFPREVLGKDYEGWSGEKWLDIRRIDLLAPIMLARLDLCQAKGFDGVEPDNMEVWTNDTGFPLTYEDQLKYAIWLADEAQKRGLAIGQKNAPDQTMDLVDLYDFAIHASNPIDSTALDGSDASSDSLAQPEYRQTPAQIRQTMHRTALVQCHAIKNFKATCLRQVTKICSSRKAQIGRVIPLIRQATGNRHATTQN